MRYKVVAESIGWILMLFSFSLFLPLVTGFFYNESINYLLISYLVPFIISFTLGVFLKFSGRGYSESIRDREAFAVVGLGWLIIAFVGSLPFVLSGTIPDIVDAYFESMSGFTTTGATILETSSGDYLDSYSHSIFLWRSLIQWLGGMGIIVLSVVILARILGGGLQLLRAEVPGPTVTRLRPKIRQTAQLLWLIYGFFTILEILLLYFAISSSGKGDALYDAICHTFTTLATGGFGTHTQSIGYYQNPLVDIIIIIFMIIAGTNFVLHYQFLTGKVRQLFKDPEFRFYILIISLATIFLTSELAVKGIYTSVNSFRYGLFQAVSIVTTTGYATADFGSWPPSSQFILLLLMFIGGCAGSTGGSIKIVRILVLLKTARREVRQVIHPRAVIPIKLGGISIPENIVRTVVVFFFIYILIFVICTVMISFMGLDIITSMSAVAATLGNVGPGLGSVGPTVTYTVIPDAGKILLALCMWLGRLEIFAGLMLFFPTSYEK
jgi:trk system potassium uptake protein TrkH